VKKRYAALSVAIIIIALFIPCVTLAAIQMHAPNSSTGAVADVSDYATKTFSDPWDMSNREDLTGGHVFHFKNVRFSGGKFNAVTNSTDAYFFIVWPGYPGAYNSFREGGKYPINANYFRRLSFRMYYGGPTKTGVIYWFFDRALRKYKLKTFIMSHGWHTYQIDLPASTWKGYVYGLRMNPGRLKNKQVSIDWIRLTNVPDNGVPIQWYESGGTRGTADIYVDNDNSSYDGTKIATVSSYPSFNSYSWNSAGVDPGTYYFYVRRDGVNSNYSDGLSINKSPIIKITDPSEQGGKDWAKTVLRNPWDFKSRFDIRALFNVRSVFTRGGVFSGVNFDGPTTWSGSDDPYIYLQQGRKAINANKYHILTFKYRFAGSFDLVRGTMSRFAWITNALNSPDYFQITRDIVTYPGWNTYTLDLKKVPRARGRYGWKGWVNTLRFDAHEDPKARRFYLDYIKLAADCILKTSYVIKFNVKNDDSTTNVSLYADRDKRFGNGNEVLLTTGNYSNGNRSYKWTPSASLKGTFYIYAIGADALNQAGYYSTGPIKVHM